MDAFLRRSSRLLWRPWKGLDKNVHCCRLRWLKRRLLCCSVDCEGRCSARNVVMIVVMIVGWHFIHRSNALDCRSLTKRASGHSGVRWSRNAWQWWVTAMRWCRVVVTGYSYKHSRNENVGLLSRLTIQPGDLIGVIQAQQWVARSFEWKQCDRSLFVWVRYLFFCMGSRISLALEGSNIKKPFLVVVDMNSATFRKSVFKSARDLVRHGVKRTTPHDELWHAKVPRFERRETQFMFFFFFFFWWLVVFPYFLSL